MLRHSSERIPEKQLLNHVLVIGLIRVSALSGGFSTEQNPSHRSLRLFWQVCMSAASPLTDCNRQLLLRFHELLTHSCEDKRGRKRSRMCRKSVLTMRSTAQKTRLHMDKLLMLSLLSEVLANKEAMGGMWLYSSRKAGLVFWNPALGSCLNIWKNPDDASSKMTVYVDFSFQINSLAGLDYVSLVFIHICWVWD